ncbi:MAG: hypothetical protein WDZ26_01955 [Nitriliruptoraceae bacterium]
MQDLEQTWLDDDTDRGPRPTRRLLIVGLAAPWVVVLLVFVVALARGSAAPPADLTVTPPTSDPTTSLAEPLTRDPTEPLVDATQVQGAWRSSTGPSAAGAVAVVAAHDWLGARRGAGDTVEVLTVEAVEQLDADTAVVTIVGIIQRDGHSTRVRLGVPVRTQGSLPSTAGDPWHLPASPAEARALVGTPVDDPAELLAASEALVDAGYLDVSVHGLERTDAWPWRVHTHARTPAGVTVDTPVLLRRHLDGFVVAGTVHPGTPR